MDKPKYVVAYGKSVTSLKGVIAQGEPVEEDFFSGGKPTFENLISIGLAVSRQDYKAALHQMQVEDPAGDEPAAGPPQPTIKGKKAGLETAGAKRK